MRRSLSWIDPRTLAAALEKVGVEAAPPRRPAAEEARSGVRSTETAPPLASPRAEPPGDPFLVPEGNLAERLEAFCQWLARNTGCRGIFIADQDGLPVLERNTGDELVAASSLMARFLDLVHSRHPSISDAGLTLELRTGERIQFLQNRSASERVCLGFVVAAPVAGPLLERAQRALGTALAGDAAPRGGEQRNPTPAEDR
jgi:hypothetical protein